MRIKPVDGRGSLPAGEWLRVGLLAGLVAAVVAMVFDLTIAEHVVDRAVDLETRGHRAALAMPEPFSRRGQRGGLVAGELILGAGVGFLLAGVATFLGPRARSTTRLWILMTVAGIWGVVVLPGLVYPPLPPGVPSAVAIGERAAALAVVVVGVGGFAAAVHVWSTAPRFGGSSQLPSPSFRSALRYRYSPTPAPTRLACRPGS